MSREKLTVCRALADWQPDGQGDHENTLILHDFTRVVAHGANAQQVQEGRRNDDPGQPRFEDLTGQQIAALNSRIGAIRAGHAAYVPPSVPAGGGSGRRAR